MEGKGGAGSCRHSSQRGMRGRSSIGGCAEGAERVENPPRPPPPNTPCCRLRPTPPTGSFVRSAGRQQRLTGRRLSHGVSVPPAPAISPTNGTAFFFSPLFLFYLLKRKEKTTHALGLFSETDRTICKQANREEATTSQRLQNQPVKSATAV